MVHAPEMKDYWRSHESFRNETIAKAMSRDDFLRIHRSLHFVDNNDKPDDAPYWWKASPILTHFHSKCLELVLPGRDLSADEETIKCKST